jgi:hypothetical protein
MILAEVRGDVVGAVDGREVDPCPIARRSVVHLGFEVDPDLREGEGEST